MLDIINPKVKIISLSWSYPIGRKANQSWWRLRWVLLPPQRLPAVIPLPLLAVPHCPTVCQLLSCHLSLLTFSSLNNTPVLTFLSISQAQNQFLPHSVLSLVLWLWNRWCTGFYQQVFFLVFFFFLPCLFSCEGIMASSQYRLWCMWLSFYLLLSYKPFD